MNRIPLALCLAAFVFSFPALALDIPGVRLGFNLGFAIHVVPAPGDKSNELGLYVSADKIISDKTNSLNITGTITNYGPVPRDGIEMHFAVDSYVGTGTSRGVAAIEPPSLPPGGTAAFTAYISLDSQKPRYARYTLTARQGAPIVVPGPEPIPDAFVIIDPEPVQPMPGFE